MCKFLVRSTRSSASHLGLLSVPCHNLSFGSHAFRISDPKIWNSLPPHILQSQTLSSFIRHLKPTTFSQPTLLSSTHPNTPWFSSETLAVYKSFTYLSSLSLYRLLFIRCKELAHKNLVQQSMSDVQVSCCTSQPLQVSCTSFLSVCRGFNNRDVLLPAVQFIVSQSIEIHSVKTCIVRVSTTPGNPGNLLEFTGPPGNFCVRRSTALVSGHKTGYQIAYLSSNWSPYFIFATAPCCIKCISCD